MVSTWSNTTKPTLLLSLTQEFVSLKIENDLLTNMAKPTLLDSLSQDYVSLEIDNEHLSNMTTFTLLSSLRMHGNAKTESYFCLFRPSLHCLHRQVKSLILR